MVSRKKLGHSSRKGRTKDKRLRLLDAFVCETLSDQFQGSQFKAADLGFGETPITSQELLAHLQQQFANCTLLAFDNDQQRIARAGAQKPIAGLSYHFGSFDLLEKRTPELQLIRVMNVLRGYSLKVNAEAKARLFEFLGPGGLLVEGTSNAEGSLLCAHIWQKPHKQSKQSAPEGTPTLDVESIKIPQPHYVGLLLAMEESKSFAPLCWRDQLPRDLRRHARGQEAVYLLLAELQARFIEELVAAAEPQASRAQALVEAATNVKNLTIHSHAAASLQTTSCLWTPTRPSLRAEVFGSLTATPQN